MFSLEVFALKLQLRSPIVPVSVLFPTVMPIAMLFDAVSSPGFMVLSVFSTLWYIVCPRP